MPTPCPACGVVFNHALGRCPDCGGAVGEPVKPQHATDEQRAKFKWATAGLVGLLLLVVLPLGLLASVLFSWGGVGLLDSMVMFVLVILPFANGIVLAARLKPGDRLMRLWALITLVLVPAVGIFAFMLLIGETHEGNFIFGALVFYALTAAGTVWMWFVKACLDRMRTWAG